MSRTSPALQEKKQVLHQLMALFGEVAPVSSDEVLAIGVQQLGVTSRGEISWDMVRDALIREVTFGGTTCPTEEVCRLPLPRLVHFLDMILPQMVPVQSPCQSRRRRFASSYRIAERTAWGEWEEVVRAGVLSYAPGSESVHTFHLSHFHRLVSYCRFVFGCWGGFVCFAVAFFLFTDQSVRSSYQPMTSLAYIHDCHSCYDERSIDQKKTWVVKLLALSNFPVFVHFDPCFTGLYGQCCFSFDDTLWISRL